VTRLVALLTVVALAAAGCSTARSGSLGPAPTAPPPSLVVPSTAVPSAAMPSSALPSPVTGAPAQPGSAPPLGTVIVQVWLVRDGKITPSSRTRPATVATSRLTLTELAAGPSPDEAAAGLATAFPAGTAFDIVGIDRGVETVSFGPAFYTGDAGAARLRRAQVVYSLTQFPTVSRVAFQSGGEPRGGPSGRADYADLLPAIVVTGPVIGQQVPSPVTVTGTADVFEGTVNVRVLDGAGREIATAFTTATCGTGCRGDYSVTVGYRLAAAQAGTVEVYEISPRDGTRSHTVAVRVTLTASHG
jgi:hypothetical protein